MPGPSRSEALAAVALGAIVVAHFRAELVRVVAIAALGTGIELAVRAGRHRHRHRHRPGGRRAPRTTDALYVALQPALAAAGTMALVLVGAASLAWLPGLALRPLVTAQPAGVLAVELVVLADLAGYGAHRLSHTVPRLWRLHAVHHSSTHLDALAGFRVHPLDGVAIGVPVAFLVGAGFDAAGTVGVLVAVQVVTGSWAHLDVRWRLRGLRRIVLTPAFHHWHHAAEPAAHGTNFAPLLPVWDLIFGTYRVPEGYPAAYGTADPVPAGFADQLRYPLAAPGDRMAA